MNAVNPKEKSDRILLLREPGYGLVLLFVFALSRIVFYRAGGKFLDSPIGFAKQYLDPTVLRNDLLEGLFYLHSQPPCFNLFLGTALKISPDPSLTFNICFTTWGALIPLLLFGSLVLVGVRRPVSFVLTLVFMLNPSLLLYEHLLYYTYCEVFLVIAAVFFLSWWSCSGTRLPLFLFWAALGCLGLVRSLFHPVFFPAAAGLLWAYLLFVRRQRADAARMLRFSLVALVPLGLVCCKNLLIFGFFGTSSWTGMSLWTKANGLPPERIEALYERGTVSRLACRAQLQAFVPISRFYSGVELEAMPCHHQADCAEWKSSGKPNFNHIGYVRLSRQLGRDALRLIRHDPGLFAFYTLGSYSLTLWHSSDSVHGLFEKHMELLSGMEKVYRFLHFGFLGVRSKHEVPGVWIRTACMSAVLLAAYAGALYAALRRKTSGDAAVPVLLLCLLVHVYVLSVSSLIEFGENNRFRLPVDAPFLVLCAGAVFRLISGREKPQEPTALDSESV